MKNRSEVWERGGSGTDYQWTSHHLDEFVNEPEHRSRTYPPGLSEASPRPWAFYSSAGRETSEFTSDETHGFAHADFTDLAASSDGLGWTTAFVSRQRENPYEKSFEACANPLITVVLNGPLSIRQMINGVSQERTFVPGNFAIVPAGVAFDAKIDVPVETLRVYLRQGVIEEVALDISKGDPERLELIPQFAAFDPLLEQLAAGLYEAAREPSLSSSLYVDHLGWALAARLVTKHSTAASTATSSREGLSQRQLNRVYEFIEANLGAKLSLADMAKDSRLSTNHFARLFKRSTGLTPYQFLMRRRIDRAQHLLAEETIPIRDIAVECGFGSQMHFTQVFTRLVGATPASYRKAGRS